MNAVSLREFTWMANPMTWFLLASAALWLTRTAVNSHIAKIARLLAIFGLCSNALVTELNGNAMPVVGMPEHFVAASTLWQRAHAGTKLVFLADQVALNFFSIGDLMLIGGGILLTFCWLNKQLGGINMLLNRLWKEEVAQDIAEYAVMLAVILVLVVGTIRLLGGSANNVFSQVNSSLQGTAPSQ